MLNFLPRTCRLGGALLNPSSSTSWPLLPFCKYLLSTPRVWGTRPAGSWSGIAGRHWLAFLADSRSGPASGWGWMGTTGCCSHCLGAWHFICHKAGKWPVYSRCRERVVYYNPNASGSFPMRRADSMDMSLSKLWWTGKPSVLQSMG